MDNGGAVKVVRDAAKLVGSAVVVGLFGVFFSGYLAHILPHKELSIWPVYYGLASMLMAFSSFGMRDTCLRLVPPMLLKGQHAQASAVVKSAVLLSLVGAVGAGAAVYAASGCLARLLMKDHAAIWVMRLIAPAVSVGVLREHLSGILMSVQEFGKVSAIRLVADIGRPALSVGLYLAFGLPGGIAGLALPAGAACLIAVWALRKYLFARTRLHPPWRLARLGMPLYGVSIATFFTTRVDYLLVGALTRPEQLATYYVATKLGEYLWYLGYAAADVATPRLAQRFARGAQDLQQAFRTCTRYIFIGLLPLCVAVGVCATRLVRLYAGEKYTQAGVVLSMLCVYAFFESLFYLHRQVVLVAGKRWHSIALQTVAGTVNAACIAAFASLFGGLGAAAARVVSRLLLTPIAAAFMAKTVRPAYDFGALRTAAVSCVLMAAFLLSGQLVVRDPVAAPVLVALGGALYLLTLWRRLRPADVNLLLAFAPRRARESRVGLAIRGGALRMFCRVQPGHDQASEGER